MDGRETELKFALPRERAEALLAELPHLAGAPARPLTSVYFDTEKRSLRRAGLALRVREEGGRYVQTLKDEGDGAISRGEWEADLPSPEPALGKLDKTPAQRVLSKGAQVAPQFAVEVQRRSAEVEEAGGRIELSLDEGEAKANGRTAPFAELELELKAGDAGCLFALARKVAQSGDLTLSFTTKAQRGFALTGRGRGRAQKFEPPKLTPKTPTAEAFRAAAKACLKQILGNAEALRERPSPEVVHQLRVGVRRFRSVLSIFKKLARDQRVEALKAELKWLAGELDAARNLDVLLKGEYRENLADKEDGQSLKHLGARLRAARRFAYARAAAAAESPRFRRLVLDLLIWVEAGPWTGEAGDAKQREQPIAKFAEKDLAKRLKKIVKRGRDVAMITDEDRHELRIAVENLIVNFVGERH
jgi:inorganic triphosphatase YgiF